MSNPLDGARAKVARAGQHVQGLEREIESFLETKPYPVFRESKADGSQHIFRLKNPKPAPVDTWGLIVGDIVHSLRSSLDHVAWQLALKNAGSSAPPSWTEFPVFRDKARYHAAGKNGNPVRGSGLSKVQGMDAKAQGLIESLQPYHRANPALDPLWVVHRLDITDKHKVIPVVAVTQNEASFSYSIPPSKRVTNPELFLNPDCTLEHDSMLAVVPVNPPDPEVQVDAQFAFMVIFGEGLIEAPRFEVVTNLRVLIPFFQKLLAQFDPLFS